MKKIKLNLDELKVNSFETNQHKAKAGTIKGNQDTKDICRTLITCNFDSCIFCSDLDCSEFGCQTYKC